MRRPPASGAPAAGEPRRRRAESNIARRRAPDRRDGPAFHASRIAPDTARTRPDPGALQSRIADLLMSAGHASISITRIDTRISARLTQTPFEGCMRVIRCRRGAGWILD